MVLSEDLGEPVSSVSFLAFMDFLVFLATFFLAGLAVSSEEDLEVAAGVDEVESDAGGMVDCANAVAANSAETRVAISFFMFDPYVVKNGVIHVNQFE